MVVAAIAAAVEVRMDIRDKAIHLTGHRPTGLGGYNKNSEENKWLLSTARDLFGAFRMLGYTHLISGMALGWDQWALEEGMSLGFHTIAAIPCAEQERTWPDESQQKYHELLDKCDEVEYISKETYKPWLMQHRNEWMVDHGVLTFAAYNGGKGGTYNCLKYARGRGNIIYTINSKLCVVKLVVGEEIIQLPR